MKKIVPLFLCLVLPSCATPVGDTVAKSVVTAERVERQSNVGAELRDDGEVFTAANDKGHSYAFLNKIGLTNYQQTPFDVSGLTGIGMLAGATASFESATFTFKHYQITNGEMTPAPEGLRAEEPRPKAGEWIALLESAQITGYNNEIAGVLEKYGALLDRDLARLQAMEESEREIFIQEIKSREAIYGKFLETAAQFSGLVP